MLITGPRRAWRWPAPCIGPTPGVSDPGALVERYANLFLQHGGRWALGDAATLRQRPTGWQLETRQGVVTAQHAVIALGRGRMAPSGAWAIASRCSRSAATTGTTPAAAPWPCRCWTLSAATCWPRNAAAFD
jgi:hypothetical protein